MHSNIGGYLWPNKLMLVCSGFWPMKPNIHIALRYFNNLRIVFHVIFVIAVVVPQVFEIIDKWGNLEILTEVGCICLLMALLIFKQCYILARHIHFEKMYWLLRDLWDFSSDFSETREEAKEVENCAWQAKLTTILFYIIGVTTYFGYVTAPIYTWKVNKRRANGSDYERHLLLNCRYWFDPSPTPIFERMFAWEAIAFYLSGQCVIGLDTSMMTIIMHIVGQFRLINARLNSIGCTLSESASSTEQFDAWMKIKDCVKHHQFVIKIADDLDSLLGPLILAQMMIAGLEICLNGYAVMCGESRDVIHLFKYSFLLAAVVTQLLLYCWPGEILIEESGRIAKTIYHDIPWFALSYDQRHDLCLMIVRSQRATQITAMRFQVMSLKKLTEIFNAAGSYMALLRNINEKQ